MLMSASGESAVERSPAIREQSSWLQLLVGVLAIAVGIAAFVWPSATIQVVGVLFGLNLLVTGLIRAGLLLFVPGYPALYRVVGIVAGVLIALVGVFCLANITTSLVLLLIVVALGWLLDGIVQIFLAVGRSGEAGGGWQIVTGLALLLGGVAVLVWPKFGLATFIAIGGTVLLLVGTGHVITAVAGLRSSRRAAG
jgi:uncharacterized membrane protein HdeD (DUF308 family)